MPTRDRVAASEVSEPAAGQASHVLILAPYGRDASTLETLLSEAGYCTTCLTSADALRVSLASQIGILVLSGEAMTPETVGIISETARAQKQWSTVPILSLLTHPDRPPRAYSILEALGPAAALIALRRPAPPNSILSAVRTLLAVRERQSTIERQFSEITDNRDDLQFLLHELDHRVRNTLAKVRSISRMTARQVSDLTEFEEVFGERIAALARAHALLAADRQRPADLMAVAEGALAPFRDPTDYRAQIEGPRVGLRGGSALTFGFFFHELATNASKHGALSGPNGCVAVKWSLNHSEKQPWLTLDWTEMGGPPVKEPVRHSFGRMLIEKVTPAELDGEITLSFPPEGFHCRLTCPLPREA